MSEFTQVSSNNTSHSGGGRLSGESGHRSEMILFNETHLRGMLKFSDCRNRKREASEL
jgi:hypothetical protein